MQYLFGVLLLFLGAIHDGCCSASVPSKDEGLNLLLDTLHQSPTANTDLANDLSQRVGDIFANHRHHKHHHRHLHEGEVHDAHSCGEVVAVSPKGFVISILQGLVDSFLPPEGDTAATNAATKIAISNGAKYDIVLSKVCSSCAQVLEMYENEVDLLAEGADSRDGFNAYCGPDKFYHDSVVSGALFQPYNATSDSFIPGVFTTTLSGRRSNSSSFDTMVNRWPKDFVTDFFGTATPEELSLKVQINLDMLVMAYIAMTGTVGLVADYVGYGEDYKGTKNYITRSAYQASGIPLWLAARKEIPALTGGCASINNKISVTGYSESGYNALATSAALNQISFANILRVHSGAAAVRVELTIVTILGKIAEGTFPSLFHFVVPMIGYSYSSTNTDKANTNTGQDLLAEEWREDAVEWMKDGLPHFIINTLIPENPRDMASPKLLAAIDAKNTEGLDSVCSDEFAQRFPDLYQDKLCEAFAENTLTDILETAPYPIELCSSPDDDVIDIRNIPEDLSVNPNLSMFSLFPVRGNHVTAGAICAFGSTFPYITGTGLNDIEESDVMTCPSAVTTPCSEEAMTEIAIPRKSKTDRSSCVELGSLDAERRKYSCMQVKKAAKKCPKTCELCMTDEEESDCSDKESSATFRAYGETVSKTCGWLSEKSATKQQGLCEFSRIRSACPKTCGVCM